MGGLALASLARSGADPLFIANRGSERAYRLAQLHGAAPVDFFDLGTALSIVDLVVCATASPGHRAHRRQRSPRRSPAGPGGAT